MCTHNTEAFKSRKQTQLDSEVDSTSAILQVGRFHIFYFVFIFAGPGVSTCALLVSETKVNAVSWFVKSSAGVKAAEQNNVTLNILTVKNRRKPLPNILRRTQRFLAQILDARHMWFKK